MENQFEDWLPEELLEEIEKIDGSIYDIIPDEVMDDRSYWDQYDEMPWNG